MVTQLKIECKNKEDHWLYHKQCVICPCVPWIDKIQGHYIVVRFIPKCSESKGHRIYGAIGEACPCITGQAKYLYDKRYNKYQILGFSPQSPKDRGFSLPLMSQMLDNEDCLIIQDIPEEVGEKMSAITTHIKGQHIDWDKYYDVWFEYEKELMDQEEIC